MVLGLRRNFPKWDQNLFVHHSREKEFKAETLISFELLTALVSEKTRAETEERENIFPFGKKEKTLITSINVGGAEITLAID